MNIDANSTDPYLWLEDITGETALDWVRAQNADAEAALMTTDRFTETEEGILEILNSDDKIPGVTKIHELYYNFWRDADHPRGYWRRTSWDSYLTDNPEWETVLDIDALNAAENEDWVWHGASPLRGHTTSVLIDLSHGGTDADVTRELSLETFEFITPEAGGFYRAEAKGSMSWIDPDSVYVATDFGPGSLTSSGYPRLVKRLTRGQSMAHATTVFEGQMSDLAVGAGRSKEPGYEFDFIHRSITFYTSETHLLVDGEYVLIDVPLTADVGIRKNWLLVELRDEWQPKQGGPTYPSGALLAIGLHEFLAGSRGFTILFVPTSTSSLASSTWTHSYLVLTILDDVTNHFLVLTPPGTEARGDQASGDGSGVGEPDPLGWSPRPLVGMPALGSSSVNAIDAYESDEVWLFSTDFLTPTTMSLGQVGTFTAPRLIKSAPSYFAADDLQTVQRFAVSDDGTRVPYFLVAPRGIALDGTTPTLLYGYGGFEISLTPSYSGGLGRSWLARGGAYALANIRGGGEYGPRWHQAALQQNRGRAFEDFAAVARDLAATGVADAAHLGAQGGSNGGLLTGNMLTQYPELFGALIIQVPLLDMFRYTKLLAGASWIAEYGDPDDPEQWDYIKDFSPYHLFDETTSYPPALITTSTRDDRVHPGHARKMAALMLASGKDVTYFENIEGGHGGAADNQQAARQAALGYEFLWQRLSGAAAEHSKG